MGVKGLPYSARKQPFIEKDLSETIAMMEKERKLTVRRVSSKRGRYRDQDEITFGDCI